MATFVKDVIHGDVIAPVDCLPPILARRLQDEKICSELILARRSQY